MYLVKSLGFKIAPVSPGKSIAWQVDQVELVDDRAISLYRNPLEFTILAGPNHADVVSASVALLNEVRLTGDVCVLTGSAAPTDYVAAVAASKVFASASTNNDLTFTAVTAGVAGNDLTVAVVQGSEGAELAVAYTAPDAVITLPSTALAAASLVIVSSGANNNLTATAVTEGAAGNSLAVEIVQGSGVSVPLSVAYSTGTATVTLPTDGAEDPVAATAEDVKTAWDASTADNTITLAFEGDGSGTVAAAVLANLAGGDDGTPIATTADEIKTAWDLSDAVTVMTVAFEGTGAGDVSAAVEAALESGADVVLGTGAGYAGGGSLYLRTTGKIYINSGSAEEPAWDIVTSA